MAVPAPRTRRDHELLFRHQSLSRHLESRRQPAAPEPPRPEPSPTPATRVAQTSPPAATDNAAWPRGERTARPSEGHTDHTHGRGRPRTRHPTAYRSLASMAPGYFWSCHPTSTLSRSSEPTCCTGYSAAPNSSGPIRTDARPGESCGRSRLDCARCGRSSSWRLALAGRQPLALAGRAAPDQRVEFDEPFQIAALLFLGQPGGLLPLAGAAPVAQRVGGHVGRLERLGGLLQAALHFQPRRPRRARSGGWTANRTCAAPSLSPGAVRASTPRQGSARAVAAAVPA